MMKQINCLSYTGYSVTEDGKVFTHRKRFGLGKGKGGGVKIDYSYSKQLNLYFGCGGYLYASISINGKQRSIPLHRLLLDAFVGPCPIKMECRHLDGDPLNNTLQNLCYGTVQQNANDRAKHGHNRRGENHPRSKLKNLQVIEIRDQYQDGKTIAKIARQFNCSESTIRDIVKGRKWIHLL